MILNSCLVSFQSGWTQANKIEAKKIWKWDGRANKQPPPYLTQEECSLPDLSCQLFHRAFSSPGRHLSKLLYPTPFNTLQRHIFSLKVVVNLIILNVIVVEQYLSKLIMCEVLMVISYPRNTTPSQSRNQRWMEILKQEPIPPAITTGTNRTGMRTHFVILSISIWTIK